MVVLRGWVSSSAVLQRCEGVKPTLVSAPVGFALGTTPIRPTQGVTTPVLASGISALPAFAGLSSPLEAWGTLGVVPGYPTSGHSVVGLGQVASRFSRVRPDLAELSAEKHCSFKTPFV